MDLYSYPQGERGRFEKIVNQFLLKSLHIILDSRVPANHPPSHSGELKKADKWFNLVLGDRPTAMDNLSFWHRSLMDPMIIDIILVQKSPNSTSERVLTETVVERWTVHYEYLRSMTPQIGDSYYKKTYKKSIVLLRSLYSVLRLLPAYKAFRKLRSLNQDCDFDINYKVCSFSAPFSREEELSMKRYSFVPVEGEQGRLSISVSYSKDLSSFNLDTSVSCLPAIISDYVGSPLAEPMREFPSTSFPVRGRRSSSLSPFQRPHSWSNGLHRNASLQHNQPVGGFSPPLHRSPYEYPSPLTDMHIQRNQYKTSPVHHGTSDESFSPPFPSSPSPSPPAYLLGGSPLQSRLRAETAPIVIPHPIVGRSPRYLSPNLSDSSRHSLPPLSPKCIKIKAGEVSSGSINVDQKVSRDGKEDSGRFSSLLSSSSSPRVGFSRSSSRLSFQDDFGDCDFSCPFIVDDVDPPETRASTYLEGRNSSEVLLRTSSKSQDAAVGALVHMLKTAPPLRQDSSYHTTQSSKIGLQGEVGAVSDFFKPRKTSDALQELNAYKDMKDLLLSKSAAHILLPQNQMAGQGIS